MLLVKHVSYMAAIDTQQPLNLIQPKDCQLPGTSSQSSNSETLVIVTEKPSSSTSSFFNKENVSKSEIIWALNKVVCHFSLRDGERSSKLFPVMFPDSTVAQKFSMHKDKLSYVLTYGLGPFFQNELAMMVKKCDYFSISFDESLNKISQKGQMDLHVRFWNNNKNETSTRYLTSTFLGHATATDLLNAFTAAVSNLGLSNSKIIQISMDGPNVNFSFIRSFKTFIKDESTNESSIIDIGSCSLHLIHGCYKTAHNKTEWNLNKFLRAIYYLFKDFPSRRADYIHFSESNEFPQKFCTIRWVENAKVIDRAIKIIPNLKKYLDGTEKKPPKSNNYGVIKTFLNDKLWSIGA